MNINYLPLIDYYQHKISIRDFMLELNSSEILQKLFEKEFGQFVGLEFKTAIQRLNSLYRKIGTIYDARFEDGGSVNEYLIYLDVEYIVKKRFKKYFRKYI